MTLRVVHRPTRTVHPAPVQEAREVEAPPTLPDGKSQGSPLTSILPMIGMGVSLTVMMVMRNPAFMAIGAVVLCVALFGALAMLFSRRGQVARRRRNQRDLYLQYLEELREDLSEWERGTRSHARSLDPPPEALGPALRAYAADVCDALPPPARPAIVVEVDPGLDLDRRTATIAYRIAQEALLTAVLHSGARTVTTRVAP